MRKKNRLLGGAVVLLAVVIAACLGGGGESTSSQHVLAIDQNPVNFGTVPVNTTVTTSSPIVIRPQGQTDDDTITSITENCSDFNLLLGSGFNGSGQGSARVHCSGGPIGSGSSGGSGYGGATYGSGACVPVTYQFNAQFTPAGPGSASCPVTITYISNIGDSSGTYTLTLMGTGQAPMYGLSIQPTATMRFSGIQVGTSSSTQPVRITNTGTAALTVSGALSNPVFQVTGNLNSHQLAAGATELYNVSCTPPGISTYIGALTFTTAQGGLTRAVNLECTGIMSDLGISPNPGGFSPALVGAAPTNLLITIANNGASTTLDVVRLSPSGLNPDLSILQSPQGSVLGAGATATVTLQYAPTAPHAGGPLGTLVIGDTASILDREITISGEALVGAVGTSPAILEFGPVCIGSTKGMAVEVYASAAGAFELTSVTPPIAPFEVDQPSGPLAGNHANVLTVNAAVTPTEAGELESAFVINTNLPTDATKEVQLTALALPAGVAPTPDLVHFGPVRVETTTIAQEVVVTNCGTTPAAITNVRIEGPTGDEFSVVSAPPTEPVGPMSSTTFLVVMTPRANGTKLAELVGDLDGGETFRATLSGNGFGGDDGNASDRGTYYACGAGVGAGALPIAIALLVLRRRRRRT